MQCNFRQWCMKALWSSLIPNWFHSLKTELLSGSLLEVVVSNKMIELKHFVIHVCYHLTYIFFLCSPLACWQSWPLPSSSLLQVMQWSLRHTQTSRCLCPSLACSASLPAAPQLRWLWFSSWPVLRKRPRLPRSAPWRAWRPPRVALRWGATTVRARARHLIPRANLHCHRTRSAPSHRRPTLSFTTSTALCFHFVYFWSPFDLLSSESLSVSLKGPHCTSLLEVDACRSISPWRETPRRVIQWLTSSRLF